MLVGAATAMLFALSGGQLLSDDFETLPFVAPGRWTRVDEMAGVSIPLTLEPLAAHRGDGGLTFTVVPDGGFSGYYGEWLGFQFNPALDAGTVTARFWVRESQTNDVGALVLAQFLADNIVNRVATEVAFNHIDELWHLQGGDVVSPSESVVLGGPFTSQAWHLVDLEMNGIGTDAGSRVLIVDGQLNGRVDGVDFSTAVVSQFNFGADYTYQNMFATVDLDDLRLDTASQGETLSPLIAQTNVGVCNPCAVTLEDWHGVARSAPYSFLVTLSSSPGLALYAMSDCSGTPLSQVRFPAGSMGPAVYARATIPGVHWVQATYVDFLSRRVSTRVFDDAVMPTSVTLGPDTIDPDAVVPNDATQPTVASDGTQYLAAWEDTRSAGASIFAARFGGDGVQKAASFPVSVSGGAREWPSAVFDGNDFLLAWDDARSTPGREIYAARVSTAGLVLDPTGVAISTDPTGQKYVPQVRCVGSDCLIVWSDRSTTSNWQLKARHVDTQLTLQEATDEVVMGSTTGRYLPRLSVGSGEYLLAWDDEQVAGALAPAATRLDSSGRSLDGDGGRFTSDETNVQLRPALAWDGTSWWVAWRDAFPSSPSLIVLARVAADGSALPGPAGPLVEGAALFDPELAFDGVNVWLAFGAVTPDAGIIMGLRYGRDGAALEAPLSLSTTAPWVGLPAMGSNGDGGTLLVWQQGLDDAGSELHHRLLLESRPKDAGVAADAGVQGDAGIAADAGAPDAGPLSQRSLAVGCGCGTSPGLLSLTALLWLMRRRPRAKSPRGAFTLHDWSFLY